MNSPTGWSRRHPKLRTVLGPALLILSSLAYSATNIYLRKVAVGCDPVWVSCIKAVPVAVCALVLVAIAHWRGQARWPPRWLAAALVANGLFVQLGGNVAFQWALGRIGLALTVPLSFGATLASGALFGRVWLGESITPRTLLSMGVLVAAIVALSSGAGQAHLSLAEPALAAPSWLVPLGVATACLSGVAYSTNGAVIRRLVTGTLPVTSTLLVISWTGVVSLGGASAWRLGLDGLWGTPAGQLGDMLLAGLLNVVAFFAFAKGLQWVGVVYANALSASQSAVCALAGVALFGESVTWGLLAGIALTVAGLGLLQARNA